MYEATLEDNLLQTIANGAIHLALKDEHVISNLYNRLGLTFSIDQDKRVTSDPLISLTYDSFNLILNLVLDVEAKHVNSISIYRTRIPFEQTIVFESSYGWKLNNEEKSKLCKNVYDTMVNAKIEEQIISKIFDSPRYGKNANELWHFDEWVADNYGSMRQYRIAIGSKLLKEQNG
jgi:hypothetical protein